MIKKEFPSLQTRNRAEESEFLPVPYPIVSLTQREISEKKIGTAAKLKIFQVW